MVGCLMSCGDSLSNMIDKLALLRTGFSRVRSRLELSYVQPSRLELVVNLTHHFDDPVAFKAPNSASPCRASEPSVTIVERRELSAFLRIGPLSVRPVLHLDVDGAMIHQGPGASHICRSTPPMAEARRNTEARVNNVLKSHSDTS